MGDADFRVNTIFSVPESVPEFDTNSREYVELENWDNIVESDDIDPYVYYEDSPESNVKYNVDPNKFPAYKPFSEEDFNRAYCENNVNPLNYMFSNISPNSVFIWDFDETITIFKKLLCGFYMSHYNIDLETLFENVFHIDKFITNVADKHFFFKDIENCDQVHIDDVLSHDNGVDLKGYDFANDGFSSANSTEIPQKLKPIEKRLLAFRYRKIKEIFNKYKMNIEELLGEKETKKWLKLKEKIENLTENWTKLIEKCLNIINKRENCVNILLTRSQLGLALAKVLLFGVGNNFPIENIYSSYEVGRQTCLQRILIRFGDENKYVFIGDDPEEIVKNLNIEIWQSSCFHKIMALYSALDVGFI